MPAEAEQQILTRLERREQVEAAPAAARALAHPVAEVDHEARTGVFFRQARGDDAHHALVPRIGREHERVALLLRQVLNHLERLRVDLLLDALALAVERAQLPREARGLCRVGREQELGGLVRLTHAAGGVDARGEHEADLHGRHRLFGQPRLLQQCVQADEVGVVNRGQPARDERAVLTRHLHDVRDRADGRECAVARDESFLPVRPGQREHELERHAAPGEVLERIRTVRSVRVNDGDRVRQRLLALVVVGDDHVHAEGPGEGDLLHAGDAAVDRDEQAHTLLAQRGNGVAGQAVPVLDAPGDIVQTVGPAVFQIVHKDHRRGDAVHIVIAEHGHALPVGEGAADAPDRAVHVAHEPGIVDQAVLLGEEGSRVRGGRDPARDEHRRDEVGVSRLRQPAHRLG